MDSIVERMRPRPLDGLRVLELGTLIAGPFAGRVLADFGAEVLKVEQPTGGDPLRQWGMPSESGDSLWSLIQSRGKKSIALDLGSPRDVDLVKDLLLTCDVLIENFRPGRLEAWGLHPDELQQRNPRLIVARISGFGQTGPLRDQPGFGTIAEAAAGLRYITGRPDQPPTRAGLSLGDTLASFHALVGILLSLIERQNSGKGQTIDIALTESVLNVLEAIIPEFGYFGAVRERTGNIAHNSAPTNAYLCSDGQYVCIAANSTKLFTSLMQVMKRDDLIAEKDLLENRGRVRRAPELDAAISSWTKNQDSDEILEKLREVRIPASKINTVADIVAEPHYHARGAIIEFQDDRLHKPLLIPGVVPKLSRTPGHVSSLGPPLGWHTEEIRKAASSVSVRSLGVADLHENESQP